MQLRPEVQSSAQTERAWFSANSINRTLHKYSKLLFELLVLVILLNEAGKLPSCSGTIFLALRAALWAFNLFLKAPICTNQSSWTFSEYKVLVV